MRSNQVFSSDSFQRRLSLARVITIFLVGILIGASAILLWRSTTIRSLRATTKAQAIALTAASINSERAAEELRQTIRLEEAGRVTLDRIGEGLSGIGDDLRAASAEDITIAELLATLPTIADGIDRLQQDLAEANRQLAERDVSYKPDVGAWWIPRWDRNRRSCTVDLPYRLVRRI